MPGECQWVSQNSSESDHPLLLWFLKKRSLEQARPVQQTHMERHAITEQYYSYFPPRSTFFGL